jgi:hypothetical protein
LPSLKPIQALSLDQKCNRSTPTEDVVTETAKRKADKPQNFSQQVGQHRRPRHGDFPVSHVRGKILWQELIYPAIIPKHNLKQQS